MTTQNRVEKHALNNQIVSMRKDVKRARLWLINNLSHRVKKLNKAKINELEIEKNQSKMQKLRSEIQLLKHIDIDEVSKFALCNKQEPPNRLTNENGMDTAQKVMLQLANHRIVQEQVHKFRKIYAVPVDRLILLIRSLGLQYQKKKIKSVLATTVEENPLEKLEKNKVLDQEKKVSKSKKIVHPLKIEKFSIAECLHHSSSQDFSKLTSNPVIQEKSEDIDDTSSLAETNVLDRTEPSHISQPSVSSVQYLTDAHHNLDTLLIGKISTTNPIVKKQINKKENFHQKIPWPKLSTPQINKTAGTMIIRQLNLDNEADTISVVESYQKTEKSSQISEPPRDSFFVGGVDLPSEENDEMKNDPIQLNSSRVHLRKNLGKKAMENKTLLQVSRNMRGLINGPIQEKEKQATITPSVSTTEGLHPSWQAKRKEKEFQINIGECKGKKIRFDTD